ncbi:hypothetical protein R3P38DRAFT_2806333 [Favolaschia claudopus]|uniref:Uncharacterized protein n=1 Tax=Favolaschia claudopus TaxID=2862362 RepID=A0AAV9ZKK2_9AGAR
MEDSSTYNYSLHVNNMEAISIGKYWAPQIQRLTVTKARQREIKACELQGKGVLQKGNGLDIESLNDVLEEQLVEDVLDEELFEELMKAHIVEQDMEINSGADDPPASTVVAKRTRTEALKAVVLLLKYLEETERSFARHLEEELATFGRETQLECTKNMASPSIANYFTRLYRRIYLRIIPMGMGYDSDDCIEGCKAGELCLDSVFASCIMTSIFVTAVRFGVDK